MTTAKPSPTPCPNFLSLHATSNFLKKKKVQLIRLVLAILSADGDVTIDDDDVTVDDDDVTVDDSDVTVAMTM